MDKKNALVFVIDALRYDVIADPVLRKKLSPNLDKLVSKGFFNKIITNAGTTQFVLPSLMSQTYPLDYDGYDTGVRNRPKCFSEIFKEAGYNTYLATSCDQFCLAHGFDRGFDYVHGLYSYSSSLKRLILRKLRPELKRYKDKQQTKDDTVKIITEELVLFLDKISKEGAVFSSTRSGANRHNKWIANHVEKEIRLLEKKPEVVLNKIENIEPFYYWTTLGKEKEGTRTFLIKVISVIRQKFTRFMSWSGLVYPKYASFQYSAGEVMQGIENKLNKNNQPWLAYIHVMDVHSYSIYRGFVDLLTKLFYLPTWLGLHLQGYTKRPFMHDLSLLVTDMRLGKLISRLENKNILKNTVILITGDHGQYLRGFGPRDLQDVPNRTFKEHIETPLIIKGADNYPDECQGLLDSMSVSATLLDAVGLKPHSSFLGVSAYDGGKNAVISENGGRGSVNIRNDDLFFTITQKKYKLNSILRKDILEITSLYNQLDDPDELKDIKSDSSSVEIINELVGIIRSERSDIFAKRKYTEHRLLIEQK